MPENSARAARLHNAPWQGVVFVTGGGTGFLAEMLSTPGASATVLDAQIPYSTAAMEELLRRAPEQSVSAHTARQLAMAAYERAGKLAPGKTQLFGFGCTASLGTNRTKKGTHRAHWALQTDTHTFTATATYDSDRASEEVQLCDQLWATITHWLVDPEHKPPPDTVLTHSMQQDNFASLLKPTPARVSTQPHDGILLLSGSFNPVHQGHRAMLHAAEVLTGHKGAFELAMRNADKPSLDYLTLEERLLQLIGIPVWVTNTPNFSEKAKLFPGAIFVTGVDTLQRIGELRFYDSSSAKLDAAIDDFKQRDITFVVFGRDMGGRFTTLDDLNLPNDLKALCQSVPEADFRQDISSTTLRNQES